MVAAGVGVREDDLCLQIFLFLGPPVGVDGVGELTCAFAVFGPGAVGLEETAGLGTQARVAPLSQQNARAAVLLWAPIEPGTGYTMGKLDMHGEGGWFLDVGICSEVQGALDVILARGIAVHGDRQAFELRMSANCCEDLKTVHSRHVDVEQQEAWRWILVALGKLPFAFEILQRLRPVPTERNRSPMPASVKAILRRSASSGRSSTCRTTVRG